MTTVLFVEDHALIARTIIRFLERRSDLQIQAVVDSAEAALLHLASAQDHAPPSMPDLVMVDVSLPDMSGIDLVAMLKEKYPELPCLMISGHRESHYVRRALEAGARGYLAKDNPLAILEAVERVLQGEIYLSDELEF